MPGAPSSFKKLLGAPTGSCLATGSKKLLGAPGIAKEQGRSQGLLIMLLQAKLLAAPGIATRSKDATTGY